MKRLAIFVLLGPLATVALISAAEGRVVWQTLHRPSTYAFLVVPF